MTVAILGIIAALVPLIVLLVKRRVAVNDNPELQAQKKRDEVSKIIANGDSDALNVRIDDNLNRLRSDKDNPR